MQLGRTQQAAEKSFFLVFLLINSTSWRPQTEPVWYDPRFGQTNNNSFKRKPLFENFSVEQQRFEIAKLLFFPLWFQLLWPLWMMLLSQKKWVDGDDLAPIYMSWLLGCSQGSKFCCFCTAAWQTSVVQTLAPLWHLTSCIYNWINIISNYIKTICIWILYWCMNFIWIQ